MFMMNMGGSGPDQGGYLTPELQIGFHVIIFDAVDRAP